MIDHIAAQTSQTLAILLLYFVVHLVIGTALITRTGRRPLLWTIMETASRDIERRLNRASRSETERLVRGFVVVVVLSFSALVAGYLVTLVSVQPALSWVAGIIMLSLTVSAMIPIAVMRGVARRLADHKPERAIAILQPHLAEDISGADTHAIVRKSIEFGVTSLNIFLVAPVLAYVLLHPPGLVLYVTLMAMYRAFGYISPQTLYFGATVRALERVVNWIPARLTALLLVVGAAVISKGHPLRALKTGWQQSNQPGGRNRGVLMAVAAGGLGVMLGGPRRYLNGHVSGDDWVGKAGDSARLESADLRRGGMLCFVVFLMVIILSSSLFMMRI